jgi:hypothetical protein
MHTTHHALLLMLEHTTTTPPRLEAQQLRVHAECIRGILARRVDECAVAVGRERVQCETCVG